MTTDELDTIAHDATFQIQCALTHIDWLRAVLRVTEDRLKLAGDNHGATVVNLAIYHADISHNDLDCEREKLELRIDSVAAAPQTPGHAKRGAPLVDGPSATVGERLLLARKWAGLTQAKLAKKVGMDQAAVSQLETGESLRTTYVAELAHACGVSTDWLALGPEMSA